MAANSQKIFFDNLILKKKKNTQKTADNNYPACKEIHITRSYISAISEPINEHLIIVCSDVWLL